MEPNTQANNSDIFPSFLKLPVDEVAKQLLGCMLVREIEGRSVRVRIVETESYDQDDEASHAFGGMRKRNATMFKQAGHLYVYFTYGMHYCCNVVTGELGHGSGVLIRAVEPLDNQEFLEKKRGIKGVSVTNGPAKLCQALGINRDLDGHDLHNSPLILAMGSLRPDESIASSTRIGISRAKDALRHFYIYDNPYVSRGK